MAAILGAILDFGKSSSVCVGTYKCVSNALNKYFIGFLAPQNIYLDI